MPLQSDFFYPIIAYLLDLRSCGMLHLWAAISQSLNNFGLRTSHYFLTTSSTRFGSGRKATSHGIVLNKDLLSQ